MRCLARFSTLLAAIFLLQALSMAPSFAQSAKARVGAAAVAIISGRPSATVAAAPQSAAANCAASPNCILVNVPQVVPWGEQTDSLTGRMQITSLTVTLDFSDQDLGGSPVTLTFTSPDSFADPSQKSWQVTLKLFMPGDPSCVDPHAVACHDFPVPSNLNASCPTCKDTISVVPSYTSKFDVRLVLLSDYNVGGKDNKSLCASTQSQNPKQYQIASTLPVSKVCTASYSKSLLRCLGQTENLLNSEEGATVDAGSVPVSCGQ
jgi:hypothetical protein